MNYLAYEEKIRSAVEFSDFFTLGESLFSQPVYASHVGGYSGRQVIVQCAIHAREYVTSLLGVELARHAAARLRDEGAYFIYNANPDGVRLVLDGAGYVPCPLQRDFLLAVNEGSEDFSLYKANGAAVDLNTNFDAKWGGGAMNRRCPAPESFIGYYPMSEREVRLLSDFTSSVRPYATLSYHTKGEVIYYGFEGQSEASLLRDKKIAERLAAATGYAPVQTVASTGGYKDWCIEKFDIPSFTIEVAPADAAHPVNESILPELYEQNKNVLEVLFA